MIWFICWSKVGKLLGTGVSSRFVTVGGNAEDKVVGGQK